MGQASEGEECPLHSHGGERGVRGRRAEDSSQKRGGGEGVKEGTGQMGEGSGGWRRVKGG